jgi:hypothetical protein
MKALLVPHGARRLWRLRTFIFEDVSVDLEMLLSRLPRGSAIAVRPLAFLSRDWTEEQSLCDPGSPCTGAHEVLVALQEPCSRKQAESWLESPSRLFSDGTVVESCLGTVVTPRPWIVSDVDFWTLLSHRWMESQLCRGSLVSLTTVLFPEAHTVVVDLDPEEGCDDEEQQH